MRKVSVPDGVLMTGFDGAEQVLPGLNPDVMGRIEFKHQGTKPSDGFDRIRGYADGIE